MAQHQRRCANIAKRGERHEIEAAWRQQSGVNIGNQRAASIKRVSINSGGISGHKRRHA